MVVKTRIVLILGWTNTWNKLTLTLTVKNVQQTSVIDPFTGTYLSFWCLSCLVKYAEKGKMESSGIEI